MKQKSGDGLICLRIILPHPQLTKATLNHPSSQPSDQKTRNTAGNEYDLLYEDENSKSEPELGTA